MRQIIPSGMSMYHPRELVLIKLNYTRHSYFMCDLEFSSYFFTFYRVMKKNITNVRLYYHKTWVIRSNLHNDSN